MRIQAKTAIILLIISLVVVVPAVSEGSAAPSASILDNGLEVAYLRRGTAPWVSLRVVFRAGAIAQSQADAGVFQVCADLLAEGNAAHPDAESFRAALLDMGASAWEARAAEESVSFGFTVPASRLGEGLAFLAAAVGSPSFPSAALGRAKRAAADRAAAAAARPEAAFQAAMAARVFPKYPHRRDAAGSPAAISALSEAAVRAAAARYFVPNNCLLVASGGVEAAEFDSAARAGFGSWARGENPWKASLPPNPLPPVKRSAWILWEDPDLSEGEGIVEMRYRGPDAAIDPKNALAALLFKELASAPGSAFKAALAKSVPGLAGPEAVLVDAAYARDGGQLTIRAEFATDPSRPAWQTAMMSFKEQIRGLEIESIRRDPVSYFGKDRWEQSKAALASWIPSDSESPAAFIASYSRVWTASSSAAWANWAESSGALGPDELRAFIFKYVNKNLEIVALRLSPADYARESKAALERGFTAASHDKAFWWSVPK